MDESGSHTYSKQIREVCRPDAKPERELVEDGLGIEVVG